MVWPWALLSPRCVSEGMVSLPLMTFTLGLCRQLLPNLTEWQNNPPQGAPKLLIVSSGMQEVNKEMSLSFPLILDQQHLVGRAFGASGTLLGGVLDAVGKVALRGGRRRPAVLDLAKARRVEA